MTSPNPFADDPRLNPYAAPQGSYQPPPVEADIVGIWQSGKLVVIHQSLDFPERCIWTNEPGKHRGTLTLTYTEGIDLLYSTLKFSYSLSPASWRKRMVVRLIPWILIVGGAALWYWGMKHPNRRDDSNWPITAGVTCTIVGAIAAWWTARIMTLVRKDGPYFVLRGAKEPFLNSLPEWDGKPLPRR